MSHRSHRVHTLSCRHLVEGPRSGHGALRAVCDNDIHKIRCLAFLASHQPRCATARPLSITFHHGGSGPSGDSNCACLAQYKAQHLHARITWIAPNPLAAVARISHFATPGRIPCGNMFNGERHKGQRARTMESSWNPLIEDFSVGSTILLWGQDDIRILRVDAEMSLLSTRSQVTTKQPFDKAAVAVHAGISAPVDGPSDATGTCPCGLADAASESVGVVGELPVCRRRGSRMSAELMMRMDTEWSERPSVHPRNHATTPRTRVGARAFPAELRSHGPTTVRGRAAGELRHSYRTAPRRLLPTTCDATRMSRRLEQATPYVRCACRRPPLHLLHLLHILFPIEPPDRAPDRPGAGLICRPASHAVRPGDSRRLTCQIEPRLQPGTLSIEIRRFATYYQDTVWIPIRQNECPEGLMPSTRALLARHGDAQELYPRPSLIFWPHLTPSSQAPS
ncbi:hypothetical protein G7046_g3550 [Stylonectria norvegica]|nr:hypothetical protein G7046_g3550 [Stylonectria norvegica]